MLILKIEGRLFLSPFPSFLFLNNSVVKPLGRRGGGRGAQSRLVRASAKWKRVHTGVWPDAKKGEEGILVTSGQGGETPT